MEFKSVHIGSLVKQEMQNQRITIVQLGKLLGINISSTRSIFKKADLHPVLLRTISKSLNVDFFKYLVSVDALPALIETTPAPQEWEVLKKENEMLREINQLLREQVKNKG